MPRTSTFRPLQLVLRCLDNAASAVKPNSPLEILERRRGPGEDRMRCSRPFAPTYFVQPKTDASSTETRP